MEITNELRNRADELNRRQMEILDRFPVLMGLDDADRRPIMDELMKVEELRDVIAGIKNVVVGPLEPCWSEQWRITNTRMWIANKCDAALNQPD